MEKEKVILLNPPGDALYIRDYYCSFSSKADYYWPPQDLLALSGILSGEFQVEVIDAIINRKTEEEVIERISSSGARAVIFTTGTATLLSDFQLAEKLKKTGIKILVSAGILKFIWKEIFRKYDFIDAVLIDFSEPSIISYLKGNSDFPLKGLIYRKNGALIEYQEKLPAQFRFPVPRHDLFDLSKYKSPLVLNFPFAEVITSLGCPYRCAFCTAGAYGYRLRDVDNLMEELRYLHKLGVKELLFQDPTFTIKTKRVVEICEKMVRNDFQFTWSCNGDVKSLNEAKVSAMKEAGCHTVSIGIESGDDEILEKYSKMISVGEIEDAVGLLAAYKIRVLGYFIIGLPGENRESVLKTIALAKKLPLDYASFAIATPDIGTRLRTEALQEGWMSAEEDVFDSTGFPVMETPQLSKNEVWKLRKKAVWSFYMRPSYWFRKLKQIHSIRELRMLASNALSLFRKS